MLWTLLRGGFSSFDQVLFMLGAYVVLLGVMMPVHEAAHAWAAVRLGDQTPRFAGRLTLNPLAHLDPIGALMIVLFGIGYARPVPVDPRNFKKPRRDMALTALAGPMANLLMAVLCVAVFRLVMTLTGGQIYVQGNYIYYTGQAVYYAYIVCIQVLASTNLMLAVFNLLPLPPLDGSRIFGALLPPRWTYWMDQYHTYVRMAVMLLVVTGVLDGPLTFLEQCIGNAICALFGLSGLF